MYCISLQYLKNLAYDSGYSFYSFISGDFWLFLASFFAVYLKS